MEHVSTNENDVDYRQIFSRHIELDTRAVVRFSRKYAGSRH